jgi:hypothetical protein
MLSIIAVSGQIFAAASSKRRMAQGPYALEAIYLIAYKLA